MDDVRLPSIGKSRLHVPALRGLLAAGIALLGIALLVACRGGAGVVAALPTPSPTPTATLPAPASFATSTSVPVAFPSAGGSASIALPAASGFGGSLALPVGPGLGSTTASLSFTSQPPQGIPTLSSARLAEALRGPLDAFASLAYVCVSFPQSVALSAAPTVTLTLPASYVSSSFAYYLALYTPTTAAWNAGYGGPGQISGTTVALTGSAAVSFPAGQTVCFALSVELAASAAPTPLPSGTATATTSPTAGATASASASATASPTTSATASATATATTASTASATASATSTSTASPTAPPIATPSFTPQAISTALASGTAAVVVPLPTLTPAGAVAAQISLPAGSTIPANTSVTETISSSIPAGLPSLSFLRSALGLQTQGVRTTQSARSALVVLQLGFNNTVTLAGGPTFSVAIPASDVLSGIVYYLALYDPTNSSAGWQVGFEGPVTPSTTLSFSGASGSETLVGGDTYYYAAYAVSVNLATPTPAPTAPPIDVPIVVPTPIGIGPTPPAVFPITVPTRSSL